MNSHEPGNPDFEATTEILTNLRKYWISQASNSKLDPMRFSQLGLVALTQWSAMVGVDVGIPEDMFIAICQANFREAFKRAPKFS